MLYTTIAQLLEQAELQSLPVWKIVLLQEQKLSGLTEKEIYKRLGTRYDIMCRSAKKALTKALPTAGGLIEGIAKTQYVHVSEQASICGEFLNLLMARALSCSETNAAMGKICAAPTAGSCGILPAVLVTVGERYELEKQDILNALLTASGFGAVVMQNATVSGAEGGCQAECGVAAAMASAAAVQMAGGTAEQMAHAFSLSLMNCLGLICDPLAGLVQVPCAQRNASQAVNAVLSADLALAGMKSLIPADEMIEAMYKVGQLLPAPLRETAQGGIAATKTGKDIMGKIFG